MTFPTVVATPRRARCVRPRRPRARGLDTPRSRRRRTRSCSRPRRARDARPGAGAGDATLERERRPIR
jgi:hypothetical protein